MKHSISFAQLTDFVLVVPAVGLQAQRHVAHLKQQLQKGGDQRVVLHAPHQKLLLTEAAVLVQPAAQRVEGGLVGVAPAAGGVGVARQRRVGSRGEQLVEGGGGLGTAVVALAGHVDEGLDHVLQFFGVQVAVPVHVEYFETNCKKGESNGSLDR